MVTYESPKISSHIISNFMELGFGHVWPTWALFSDYCPYMFHITKILLLEPNHDCRVAISGLQIATCDPRKLTYRNQSRCRRLIIYQFHLLFVHPILTLIYPFLIGYLLLSAIFVTSFSLTRHLAWMNLREHLVLDLFFHLKASCAIF